MAPGHCEGFILDHFRRCIEDKQADIDVAQQNIQCLECDLDKDISEEERQERRALIEKFQLEIRAAIAVLQCLQQGEKEQEEHLNICNQYWT